MYVQYMVSSVNGKFMNHSIVHMCYARTYVMGALDT